MFSFSRCPALFGQQLINPRPMFTGARGTNTNYSHQRRGRIPRSSPRGLVPLCRGRAPVQQAASAASHRPGLRCRRQGPPRKHNAASAAAAPKTTGYSTTHQAPRTRTTHPQHSTPIEVCSSLAAPRCAGCRLQCSREYVLAPSSSSGDAASTTSTTSTFGRCHPPHPPPASRHLSLRYSPVFSIYSSFCHPAPAPQPFHSHLA